MALLESDLVMELERIGEAEVRARLARGEFGMVGSSKSRVVNAWLNTKESQRSIVRESKALSISEEALSTAHQASGAAAAAVSEAGEAMAIGRLAVSVSRRANITAMVAMICSLIALITAVIIVTYK
jgi:hypothetical protein